jgi:hypothetical protein
MRRAITDYLNSCDSCTSRLKYRTSVPPSTILYWNHTPDVHLNEMEVKFTTGDWCHPVSWRMINAFHGIDVGNSCRLGSCQQRFTRLESSNFILITVKNYVLPHKIFLHDNFYYTVNMSFGTRTYFRLRYVTSEISVSPMLDICTTRYALLGLYTERYNHKKPNACIWMLGRKKPLPLLKKYNCLVIHTCYNYAILSYTCSYFFPNW